jgi:hypothetical protein
MPFLKAINIYPHLKMPGRNIIMFFLTALILIVVGCQKEKMPEKNLIQNETVLKSPQDNASELVPSEVIFKWRHPGGNNISFDLLVSADSGNSWKLIPAGYDTLYTPAKGEIRGSTSYLWQLVTRKGEVSKKSQKYRFSTVKQYVTNEYETYFFNGEGKVNLVILGDGFVKEDLLDKGNYQLMAHNLIDHIFSIEPYKSYKSYFNAYIFFTESDDRGILRGEGPAIGELTHPSDSISTYFESSYDSYGLNTLKDKCYQVAEQIPGLDADQSMICLVLNDKKYGGMTWMNTSGRAIPICPMSNHAEPFAFYNLVMHETGHAFAKLADEYGGNPVPADEQVKSDLLTWQNLGWYLNVSVSRDTAQVPWKYFLRMDKYSGSSYSTLGIFEGGYSYWYGIYRPEEENCMRGAMIPYYDVASREMIVKRIMKIVGEEYTIEKFLLNDKIIPASLVGQISSKNYSVQKNLYPHNPPVVIDNTGILTKSY